jgi:hypothetical protein
MIRIAAFALQAMQHHSTGVRVIEDRNIDPEELNATVIGLATRLAFLGVILFLALSIISPFLETIRGVPPEALAPLFFNSLLPLS